MELWFTLENYGTMEKKLWYFGQNYIWYYTENYGAWIYEGKNMVDYLKLRNFD